MQLISTSNLAKKLQVPVKYLFKQFILLGWIERKNDTWILTDLGKQNNGEMRRDTRFGEYIVWPEDILKETNILKHINATDIGKHFNISSRRLNLIIAELGWVEKNVSGWKITKLGEALGGIQMEHKTSGVPYVIWPDKILGNKNLISVFTEHYGFIASEKVKEDNHIIIAGVKSESENNFRHKFPAELRTRDGHIVRSRAEALIDGALYDYGLAHAYERKLPITEELYSDFFIPSKNVYIEYWGMENDPNYAERKKEKIEIYKKYDFKLIELTNEDILNLDDILPKKLLKFDIKIY